MIDRHIFGQFAEHLGSGIYGGIWVGKVSTIPNTRGIRNDVVAALKALIYMDWMAMTPSSAALAMIHWTVARVLYNAYLGRDPSTSEINVWKGLLADVI